MANHTALKKYVKIALKTIGWVFVGLVILFIALVLLVRSPWGQNLIVQKATGFVSSKIETPFTIDRLFITFDGNVYLEGLYLEDQIGDTLVYSSNLEVSVALLPIIQGTTINVDLVDWNGLIVRIKRSGETENFNFQYIIDAFTSEGISSDTTNSTSPTIQIGDISFRDFDLLFVDESLGINSRLNLGQLHLTMEELDLENLLFHIDELTLKDINGSYVQTKLIESDSADTPVANEASPLPTIIIDELNIYHFTGKYHSSPSAMFVDGKVETLELEAPLINLTERKVDLNKLLLNNSSLELKTYPNGSELIDTARNTNTKFLWPDWEVDARNLQLADNRILLITDSTSIQQGLFNPSQIELSNLGVNIEKASLKNKEAFLLIDKIQTTERSGFQLKDLGFEALISETDITLSDLMIATSHNQISGNMQLSYTSVDELINHPGSCKITSSLSAKLYDLEEAYTFVPELDTINYFRAVAQKPLSITIDGSGSFEQVTINQLDLNWGNTSKVNIAGKTFYPTNMDKIRLQDLTYSFSTTQKDLSAFIETSSTGIAIPKRIAFEGQTSGSMNEIITRNRLISTEGNASLHGHLIRTNLTNEFKLTIVTDSIQLGHIIQSDELGPISLSIETSGNGTELNNLDAQFNASIQSLIYSGYRFDSLLLNGQLRNGQGKLSLDYEDKNLIMQLQAKAMLDSLAQKVELGLDVEGADLRSLGLTQHDIRTRFSLAAKLSNTDSSMQINFELGDATIVKNLENYTINPIRGNFFSSIDSTSAHLTSDVIKAKLESNASPDVFITALKDQLSEYLSTDSLSIKMSQIDTGVVVRGNLSIRQNLLVNEILVPGLQEYDSITLSFNFVQAQDSLTAFLNAPYINYNEQIFDNLKLEVIGSEKKLNFSAGWDAITAGPINMQSFDFNGFAQGDKLVMRMEAPDENGSILDIRTQMKMTGDTLEFSVEPDTFIMHRNLWTLPEQNKILIAPNYIHFENFSLKNGNQQITLSNFGEELPHQNIKFSLDQFDLISLTSFLNPTDTIASGIMNGDVSMENVFGNAALIADLKINELSSQGTTLGNLNMSAQKGNNDYYSFDMGLENGEASLALIGEFEPAETGTNLDLNLQMKRINSTILNSFFADEISNPKGYLTGEVRITGSTDAPIYKGSLHFRDFGLKINSLNTSFFINNESLKVDNAGIYLNQFDIHDQHNNSFNINGQISTRVLTNPKFDLKITARNFTAIDSEKGDNELFYGSVGLDADLTVTGDLTIPRINGTIGILKNSDFTMIVPESQADLVEREGIVTFVNKKNPKDILTRTDEKASNTLEVLSGIDLHTNLSIGKGATFKIVINERTGDNFQISGKGEFNFGMEANGRTTLAGIYSVSDGHFEASLYNLVKRKFSLAPGGTITWSGDPLSAELDIQAIYNVKTSPAPLIQAQSNPDGTTTNYQQQLPFDVYLNLDGTILQPELSFALDLDENERGASGGQVYAAVQQLNNSEEQLNKQVFSLLVLNRFFPAAGSDGSSGGTASIARNNVNNVLSSQLNSLSNKVTGDSGFQLDFGINSYTNHQGETSEDRTDVNINASQRLFNNRVIVQVGSEVNVEGSTAQENEETTPLIGNVSIEYLVTKNGRYRFKGFRKNEYQNVIDGQLIVTGFAFIFAREFNRFQQIWKKESENLNQENND